MIFAVNGTDREDAVRKAKDFVTWLLDPSAPRWTSPHVARWRISKLLPAREISTAPCMGLGDPLEWLTWSDWSRYSRDPEFRDRYLVNIHGLYPERDGLVYAANRFRVGAASRWVIRLDHDSPPRLFVDGAGVLTDAQGDFQMGRQSRAEVELSAGEQEIVVALDTDEGRRAGFYFAFEVPEADRSSGTQRSFPVLADS